MYFPREDSFLLSDVLKDYLKNKDKKIKILDMGTGSGIQAETCIKLGFNNVLAADIDKDSLEYVKKKGIKVKKSNLFSNITGKFDLIAFNPPYLPDDKYDKQKDTSGGKFGDETILKFLKQASSHLNKNGKILLLLSSYTPRDKIKKLKIKIKVIAKKKVFFENLEVLAISFS